jgi:adenosylcobyric acid synthase
MSNNAAVTVDGGEIGRAQALQARAARVAPTVHMNPVLLKPQSQTGAQVVVHGRIFSTAKAAAYQRLKPDLMRFVLESFCELKGQADIVLVEGAGSASEVNLRRHDIANMGFARSADVPVILIGDIERGGVIASLVGTKAVLAAADAAMIRGFVVNKFRGDPGLFADGLTAISEATGWAALGLVPYFADAQHLPAEDALALDRPPRRRPDARIVIAVPILPRIANFDDLDPLAAEPMIDIVHLKPGTALPGDAHLVIIPGSKATVADLAALRQAGFDIDIAAHVRRGGAVLGICGGYQMLGRSIADPAGVEGAPGTAAGLGLLDVATVLSADKRLVPVAGTAWDGSPFSGYEMHIGQTEGPDRARPFAQLANGAAEGARSPSGRVVGTYVHGLFGDDRQRSAWLARLGAGPASISYDALIEGTLERLAAHIAANVDVDRLLSLAR